VYEYDFRWWVGIDWLIGLAGLVAGITVWMIAGTPVADNLMWLTSFEFFILPLVFVGTVVFLYARRSSRKGVSGSLADYLGTAASDGPQVP
jgi:hypothetical protein